jgi:RecB family exonuclease
MERLDNAILADLRKKGIPVYSFSRLDTMRECPYKAYFSYILNKKENDNAYSYMGGQIHNALQTIIEKHCDTGIIKESIETGIEDMELIGMDFPLDKDGNPTIRDNWLTDMYAFADRYEAPKGIYESEKFLLYKLNDIYVQGYADLIQTHDDGTVSIYDYKTSRKYSKKDILNHGRQLVIYGLAMEQAGYKVREIAWIFLKYFEQKYKLKNGKEKVKIGEWKDYEEKDTEISVQTYVMPYPYNEDTKQDTINFIVRMVGKYRLYEDDEDAFSPCDIQNNSFYCATLCSFRDKCKYYQDYRTLYEKDEESQLFD